MVLYLRHTFKFSLNTCSAATLKRALQKKVNVLCYVLKAAKYEKNPYLVYRRLKAATICSIQKPSTWLMFRVFHLTWSTLLMRILESGSTLSNKFWLCCSFFIILTICYPINLLVLHDKSRVSVSRKNFADFNRKQISAQKCARI